MSFRLTGLDPAPFRPLFGLSDQALAARGVKRCIADAKVSLPDRIEVRDAKCGERLLLLNYVHQPADTPYRSSHAIFVLEGAEQRYDGMDTVPEPLKVRPISLRAFDDRHHIVAADLAAGDVLPTLIEQFLADPAVAYLHAHYARYGCYAARIDRV